MASTNELLQLTHVDVSKMCRSELAKVVTQISSTANKRIARLESTEIGRESPAYKKAIKTGGTFTARGKTQGQLQGEFARLQDFFKKQTSSVKGWKEVRTRREEITGKKFDNLYDEKNFWSAYRRLEESHGDIIRQYGSENAIKMLRKEIDTNGYLQGEYNLAKTFERDYEEIQEINEEFEDFYDY